MDFLKSVELTKTFVGEDGLRDLYPFQTIVLEMDNGSIWELNTESFGGWKQVNRKNPPWTELEAGDWDGYEAPEVANQIPDCHMAWILDN